MIDTRAAERYARALFVTADESNIAAQIDRDFTQVQSLLREHPQICCLILNPTISPEKKEAFLIQILPAEISKLLSQFLRVLIRKGRFRETGEIQRKFHRFVERKQGIQEVRVMTAQPLPQSLEDKLTKLLAQKLNRRIRMIPQADAGLIGGLILRFDGKEIDASYRNHLVKLKQQLMKETL